MTEPRFLLDSNICIYATKGLYDALLAKLADQDEGSLAISTVTLAEISRGYRTADERSVLAAFVAEMRILPFDEPAARQYAQIPFKRGSFDRLIAAHALALDLTLVTNNERDFAEIPALRVENWTR